MTAWLLTILFLIIGVLCLLSLADSALRARNAWRQIKHDMKAELTDNTALLEADLIAFHGMRPMHYSAKSPARTAHNDETTIAAA